MEIIIKSLLIGWIITRFAPLSIMLDLLPNKLIYNSIKLLLTCSKCCTFWMSLILFKDIYLAISSSFIMVLLEKYILWRIEEIEFHE